MRARRLTRRTNNHARHSPAARVLTSTTPPPSPPRSSATAGVAAASASSVPVRKGHRVAVVLRKQLDNVGYGGQEVQVTPGYARNFLIPNRHAVYATELNRELHKVELSPEAAAAKTAERAQNMLKSRISSITLLFNRATSDGEKLYGAITRVDIVETLADTPLRNLKIKDANVRFKAGSEASITSVGAHEVEIEPARAGYPGLWCTLKVQVRSS